MRPAIVILFLMLFSCKNKDLDTTGATDPAKNDQVKYFPVSSKDTVLDYRYFSIHVPATWKQPNDDTLELNSCKCSTSYGRIQIGDNAFINFSEGLDVHDSYDSLYRIYHRKTKAFAPKKIKVHEIWFDVKNGYRIKHFAPVQIGNGYTGVYIDSIGKFEREFNFKFLLAGKDLDSTRNAILLQSLKTIKYRFQKFFN